MYLTYNEYKSMGGTIEEAAFNDFAREAKYTIDWYTFNRLQYDTTYSQSVKDCMYELIKIANVKENALKTGISSGEGATAFASVSRQANDGVDVEYNTISAATVFDEMKAEVGEIIKKYLTYATNSLGRRLLYRGLYPGE